MKRTQVVIFDGRSLLGETAAQLLKREADIDVTVMPYLDRETSLHSLLDQVPDIILLDGTCPLKPNDVLKLLSEQSALLNVRVIYVHDDNNTIEVYQRRSIVATHSADLVTLIRSQ